MLSVSPRPAPHAGIEGSPAVLVRELRTADPAEAHEVTQRLYPGTKLEAVPHERFWCELGVADLGPVKLVKGHWTGGVRLFSPSLERRYVLTMAASGGSDFECREGHFLTVPQRRALVLSPGVAGSIRTPSSVRARTCVVESAALTAHVASLLGHTPKEPIVFGVGLSLETGTGVVLCDLVSALFRTFDEPSVSPLLLAPLREAFVTALLTGVPHNAFHLFERPPPRSSRPCVRRAEEFIAAHATEELTVARVAEAAGVPVRSLQIAFRQARGITPMEFARERRLELARLKLLEGAPGTTVTGVVTAFGFGSSPGRFSVQYRQRFGESPSDTLARGRIRQS